MKKIIFGITALVGFIFTNCDKINDIDIKSDSELIKGTWVDSESYALQFIDFYSDNQAKFGLFSKNFEKYELFNYRLFDNQIAIYFLEDIATN